MKEEMNEKTLTERLVTDIQTIKTDCMDKGHNDLSYYQIALEACRLEDKILERLGDKQCV